MTENKRGGDNVIQDSAFKAKESALFCGHWAAAEGAELKMTRSGWRFDSTSV